MTPSQFRRLQGRVRHVNRTSSQSCNDAFPIQGTASGSPSNLGIAKFIVPTGSFFPAQTHVSFHIIEELSTRVKMISFSISIFNDPLRSGTFRLASSHFSTIAKHLAALLTVRTGFSKRMVVLDSEIVDLYSASPHQTCCYSSLIGQLSAMVQVLSLRLHRYDLIISSPLVGESSR